MISIEEQESLTAAESFRLNVARSNLCTLTSEYLMSVISDALPREIRDCVIVDGQVFAPHGLHRHSSTRFNTMQKTGLVKDVVVSGSGSNRRINMGLVGDFTNYYNFLIDRFEDAEDRTVLDSIVNIGSTGFGKLPDTSKLGTRLGVLLGTKDGIIPTPVLSKRHHEKMCQISQTNGLLEFLHKKGLLVDQPHLDRPSGTWTGNIINQNARDVVGLLQEGLDILNPLKPEDPKINSRAEGGEILRNFWASLERFRAITTEVVKE